MDLDKKSKFVEMHQMAVLRQMLTFAREALSIEITIQLQPDFSGYLQGEMNHGFDDIGQAVEHTKEFLRGHLAKQIDSHTKQLKSHIEQTKEIAKARDEWKDLGEQILEGKYEVPENPPTSIMLKTSRPLGYDALTGKQITDYNELEARLVTDLWKTQKDAIKQPVDESFRTQVKKAMFGKMYGSKK